MCMITFLPAGIPVPYDEIWNGATWNTDGHGWAVAAETGVILTGRFWNAEDALSAFEITRSAYPEAPALFHSRWATHGTLSLANVHPFTVGKNAVVAHNGILPSKFHPTKADPRSDTAILAEEFLAGWGSGPGIWTRKERKRIGRIITTGNKLVILSASPRLDSPQGWVINASRGYWDKRTGAWFSNSDYTTAYKRRIGSGWLWDSYDTDTDKETAVTESRGTECPLCSNRGHVDFVSNVCLACDSCLDCYMPLSECLCHYATKVETTKSLDIWEG